MIGSRADIEKVPIDRLAAFYQKYYQPDNAVLVIAGQFDPAKALQYVADTCGKIPRPARKLEETYTVEPAQDGERYVELRRVGNNPAVIIAWHAPALSNPDSAALEVLSGIMSGGGGRGGGGTGRLYKALVDSKKALNVRMGYEELHDPGFVLVSASLSKDQSLDDVRKTILDTVAGVVSEPPSKEEVEKEKTRILQGMERSMSNSQQAALGLTSMIASGDWRLWFKNYDELKKVTPDDVVRVAKLYFKASNRTVGEFIPDAAPDRTEVPAGDDLEAVFKDYKTTLSVSQGEAFDPSPANIEKHLTRTKLPNGLKVVMLPKTNRGGHGRRRSCRFISEISHRSPDATRPPSMTSALLMRGTNTKTRQQIQDEMVRLNAQINVNGGATGATATIQTNDKEESDSGAAPRGRNSARTFIPRIRVRPGQKTADRQSRKQQGGTGCACAPRSRACAQSITRRTTSATSATIDEQIDDLNKVTLDDVKKFHSQFYGASHGQFVVVGQFDPAEVQKTAAELFGAWTSPAPYKRITSDFRAVTPVNLKIETPDKQNATFTAELNFPMSDTDPDYAAMVVANYMFGGSITGRAPNRIRNLEGLSYGVNSRLTRPGRGHHGPLRRHGHQQSEERAQSGSSFTDELAKTLAGGFTADEVAQAKIAIRDQRIVGRSQDQGVLRLIADRAEFDRTLKWDEDIDAKIQALTADQINAAFRRHIDAASLSIVKAGDFKTNGAYQQ